MRAITALVVGLGLAGPAVAGDAFVHVNATHGYAVESTRAANRIHPSREHDTHYRNAFIGRGGNMALTFEFMQRDGSPEQCAPEQYIWRNETPETFRTGMDQTGHWVWARGRDNYRLVKTISRSDGCLKMQMDFPASEVEVWSIIGHDLFETFVDTKGR